MVKPILKLNLNKVLPKNSVTLEVNYDGCKKSHTMEKGEFIPTTDGVDLIIKESTVIGICRALFNIHDEMELKLKYEDPTDNKLKDLKNVLTLTKFYENHSLVRSSSTTSDNGSTKASTTQYLVKITVESIGKREEKKPEVRLNI